MRRSAQPGRRITQNQHPALCPQRRQSAMPEIAVNQYAAPGLHANHKLTLNRLISIGRRCSIQPIVRPRYNSHSSRILIQIIQINQSIYPMWSGKPRRQGIGNHAQMLVPWGLMRRFSRITDPRAQSPKPDQWPHHRPCNRQHRRKFQQIQKHRIFIHQ